LEIVFYQEKEVITCKNEKAYKAYLVANKKMLNQDTKKILSLAVPAALSNFLDIVQVLVDMIMLGRVSPSAIASAGISMQFLGLLYAMMATFSVGTSVVISRYIGAKQYSQANKTAFSISVFSLLLSIPFTILGFSFLSIFLCLWQVLMK
jgi:Na+-driven multidrug efflux pump